jgi:hypothetical protein
VNHGTKLNKAYRLVFGFYPAAPYEDSDTILGVYDVLFPLWGENCKNPLRKFDKDLVVATVERLSIEKPEALDTFTEFLREVRSARHKERSLIK